MAETKLYRLSRVRKPMDKRESLDSLERSKAINNGERARGQQILLEAQAHYMAAWRFREERLKNKKYTYGDQLSEIVSVDGVRMTEEQYIKKQGGIPLVMNLIRPQIRTILGNFNEQNSEPLCIARDREEQQEAETLSILLQYNMQYNDIEELYQRGMEDFLIGGVVVHKKTARYHEGDLECLTENVPPDNFIPDSKMRDVRGWDCSFAGQINDYGWGELCSLHAHSPEDYKKLVQIYGQARDIYGGNATWEEFGYSHNDTHKDFLMPTDPTLCRTIEVWKKESKPRYRCHDWLRGVYYPIETADYNSLVVAENAQRLAQGAAEGLAPEEVPLIEAEWFIDEYWHYYILSPFGDILQEGDSPYDHKGHPYVFKFYTFIDGEVHSFVSDLRPLQRYNNRLIMLDDMIRRSSSKGLLLVPRGCMNGLTEDDIYSTWAKPNGVLVVDADKFGNLPKQITSTVTNIGIHEMLAMNLEYLENIGVKGSLQGKSAFSGESGSHAQVMQQNAASSLVDIFKSFESFMKKAAYMDVKNIQQYYDEKKIMNIAGRNAKTLSTDPKKVRNIEVDISIAQGKRTPSYKMLANDFYINLFDKQAIDTEELLESVIDIPGADELLQKLRTRRQQMEQGQTPDNIPPELFQKVRGGLNPNPQAMAQLNEVVYGQPQAV